MPFARVPLLDGTAIITVNVDKDTTEVEKYALQSIHANTITVTSMPTVCQTHQLLMRTATNANVLTDIEVMDTYAVSTSHHATDIHVVPMKSDKLSPTNMVPKHVSADVPKVSSTRTMVALKWDLATTITAMSRQHAFQLEHHTAKGSHANVMMDSKVMVSTLVVPLIHVPTVTHTLHAKSCLATVVPT